MIPRKSYTVKYVGVSFGRVGILSRKVPLDADSRLKRSPQRAATEEETTRFAKLPEVRISSSMRPLTKTLEEVREEVQDSATPTVDAVPSAPVVQDSATFAKPTESLELTRPSAPEVPSSEVSPGSLVEPKPKMRKRQLNEKMFQQMNKPTLSLPKHVAKKNFGVAGTSISAKNRDAPVLEKSISAYGATPAAIKKPSRNALLFSGGRTDGTPKRLYHNSGKELTPSRDHGSVRPVTAGDSAQ